MTERVELLRAAFENARLGGIYAPVLLNATRFGPTWQTPDGDVEISPSELASTDPVALARFVDNQKQHAMHAGGRLRWTVYSHDHGDLDTLLPAAGFILPAGTTATLACNFTAEVAQREPRSTVASEKLVNEDDLREACALLADPNANHGLWADSADSLYKQISAAMQAGGDSALFGARVDKAIVAAGYMQVISASDRAWLYGAVTAPSHRGTGLFTRLVIDRARYAVARGVSLLAAEASEHSLPVLESLGFAPISTARTYLWRAPSSSPDNAPEIST